MVDKALSSLGSIGDLSNASATDEIYVLYGGNSRRATLGTFPTLVAGLDALTLTVSGLSASTTAALAGKVAKAGDTMSGPLGVTPTTGRQVYTSYGWGDLSSTASGEAMVGNNIHLSFQGGADRCVISNTHASLGYAAIKFSYSSLWFASYSGAVVAGDVVTPTWRTVWHSGNPASEAQAQAGADNTVGMTPLRTWDAIKAATVGSASRSWHDVASSRAVSTTYYNTNSYPIEVSVAVDPYSGQWNTLSVGGVSICSSLDRLVASAVVPPGAAYQVYASAPGATIQHWAELY
jgi:hypothetical protein